MTRAGLANRACDDMLSHADFQATVEVSAFCMLWCVVCAGDTYINPAPSHVVGALPETGSRKVVPGEGIILIL